MMWNNGLVECGLSVVRAVEVKVKSEMHLCRVSVLLVFLFLDGYELLIR